MCNRARLTAEPEMLFARFDASWAEDALRPNKDPEELFPRSKAYVLRRENGRNVLDVMTWDVLGGAAAWPMTNVRNLGLQRWRALAGDPSKRCLVPVTEFCEWTPETHDVGGGKPVKGELWFAVPDQPVFAIAGFWQQTARGAGFTMVTCSPNEIVAPVHPQAMVTILAPEDQQRWLTSDYNEVVLLQRPYPAGLMTVRGPVFPTRKAEK